MAISMSDRFIRGAAAIDRPSDVARATLAIRLAAVQIALPLAAQRADEDVEYVHDLRVWSRRAVAALDLYAEFLPPRRLAQLKRQLKNLRNAANEARDCDVLIQNLSLEPHTPQTRNWLKQVRRERAKAQTPICRAYRHFIRKRRFERQIGELFRRTKSRRPEEEPHFGVWARARLRPIVERFFAAVPPDDAEMEQLHRFRIRGKDLRYAMELLADAFTPAFKEQLYPMIEAIQEKLGPVNDLAAAQARLKLRLDRRLKRKRLLELQRRYVQQDLQLAVAQRAFQHWFSAKTQTALRAQFQQALAAESCPAIAHGQAISVPFSPPQIWRTPRISGNGRGF
jgi:CHAD domain-containing protein